jgi:outer membrane protein assembly factor BamB
MAAVLGLEKLISARSKKTMFRRALIAFLMASAPGIAVNDMAVNCMAADWPQYLGPTRTGISPETGLLSEWPESGPALEWTFRDAGIGFSSMAIADGRMFTCGARDEQEFLICVDVNSGKELWAAPMGEKFDFNGNQWGAGPRSTPSVADGRVVALGGGGQLICVDAKTGALQWQQHMMADLGGEVNPIGGGPGTKPGEPKIGWGYSWSPLIDGDRVIGNPGGPKGAAIAWDLATGEIVWRSTEFLNQASYASPVAAEIDGVKQYIFLHNNGLTGVAADDGRNLWIWEKKYADVVIPTPIVVGNQIYVSAGSSPSTCDLVSIVRDRESFSAQSEYKGKTNRVMKNTVSGSVILDGKVYGYSDKVGWVCQDLETGDQVWAARQPLKAGSVIAADGKLLCYDEESRDVALVDANPKEFVLRSSFTLPEETKFPAPSSKNWTPMSISEGKLYVRDQELIFRFAIK